MRMLLIITSSILLFTSCEKKDNVRSFNFVYSVEVESTNNKKLELWIPIPKSSEVQAISNLVIDADDLNYTIEDEEKFGNKYLYINHPKGTKDSKVVNVSFDVLRKEHSNVNYSDVNSDIYLSSTSMIPVGGVFNKIVKENNLSKNDMKGVYEYVLNGMHYGKPKSVDNIYYKDPWLTSDGEYGMRKVSRDEVVSLYKYAKSTKGNYTFGNGNSMYACDIGVGNCTDYHSYFISLSRTLASPARFHMGFPIPDGEEGKVKGYHCWADYFVEGEGWYPVDISEADKAPEKAEYFFGTVDKDRVEMMVGRDFKLKGYGDQYVNLFIYPLMEVSDVKSDAFEKSFKYKNI